MVSVEVITFSVKVNMVSVEVITFSVKVNMISIEVITFSFFSLKAYTLLLTT